MTAIDLCVVSHNNRNEIERFLDTLESTTACMPSYKLRIADNGSTDGTAEFLQEATRTYLCLDEEDLYLNENIGYSAACNQLASKGKSWIIGLLNADVWLTEQDLIEVFLSFERYPNQHILGPKQRDENGYIRHAGIIGENTKPRHRGWNEHDPEDKLYKDRIECVTISGSAYFIKRSVWNAMTNNARYQNMFPGTTGAFLPTPHYFEETWCSYFARHLGYNVWYDGNISIGHTWMASTNGPDPKLRPLFLKSQKIFREACDTLGIEHD